jgi:conjugative relaxase-like TrwC/TraI family protein
MSYRAGAAPSSPPAAPWRPGRRGVTAAVVLRIHVVREGGHAYYVDDLVPGRAEGTLVAGEEPGSWWGRGSADLGQRDRVDPRPFADLLAGRHPVSGAPMRARRAGRSVSGYDLTFGAPKSVSLLHLLGPREIAEQSGAAHRVAVEEALGYLERAAVGVRRSRTGEVTRVPAAGLVAGAFLHRTSRALDPHLHTHVVAANVAQGVDGVWSAVDSRRLFAHAQAAQSLYHARLRLEIGERLGATFEVAPSGLGDVLGVDHSLRRLFSQRAAAMDEYRFRRAFGSGAGRMSRGAFHATRPDKDRTRTVESLRTEWRERAALFGIDLGDLIAVVGPSRPRGGAVSVERGRVHTTLGGLARHGRSIARTDVVAAVAAASTAGSSAREIESVADGLIALAGPSTRSSPRPDVLGRGGDGRVGPEPRWWAEDLVQALPDWGVALERRADRRVLAGRARTGPEWASDGRDRRREPPHRAGAFGLGHG